MSAVTHPRFGTQRARNARAWWAKAWQRAVEESVYHGSDLRAGRRLANAGHVGGLTVDSGSLVAAVQVGDDAWTVSVAVPVLHPESIDTLVELVAAESGRLPALMDGELPHLLVEQAEDAGVELLPYGGELGTTCTCAHWTQPCHHALAVLTQFTWLLDADPFCLLQLRGLPRQDLLAALHARTVRRDVDAAAGPALDQEVEADVDTAFDAAVRSRRILELLEKGEHADHLW
ncbi:MAG: hypothetical protein L0H93_06635 [Nocardioides sp.]|nr:hypothetical protein [Nocardioides sp.]